MTRPDPETPAIGAQNPRSLPAILAAVALDEQAAEAVPLDERIGDWSTKYAPWADGTPAWDVGDASTEDNILSGHRLESVAANIARNASPSRVAERAREIRALVAEVVRLRESESIAIMDAAIGGAVLAAMRGEVISDFMESFGPVREAMDRRAALVALCGRLAEALAEARRTWREEVEATGHEWTGEPCGMIDAALADFDALAATVPA